MLPFGPASGCILFTGQEISQSLKAGRSLYSFLKYNKATQSTTSECGRQVSVRGNNASDKPPEPPLQLAFFSVFLNNQRFILRSPENPSCKLNKCRPFGVSLEFALQGQHECSRNREQAGSGASPSSLTVTHHKFNMPHCPRHPSPPRLSTFRCPPMPRSC